MNQQNQNQQPRSDGQGSKAHNNLPEDQGNGQQPAANQGLVPQDEPLKNNDRDIAGDPDQSRQHRNGTQEPA